MRDVVLTSISVLLAMECQTEHRLRARFLNSQLRVLGIAPNRGVLIHKTIHEQGEVMSYRPSCAYPTGGGLKPCEPEKNDSLAPRALPMTVANLRCTEESQSTPPMARTTGNRAAAH